MDWIGFSYAVLVSAGGVVGYVKAGRRQTVSSTIFKSKDSIDFQYATSHTAGWFNCKVLRHIF